MDKVEIFNKQAKAVRLSFLPFFLAGCGVLPIFIPNIRGFSIYNMYTSGNKYVHFKADTMRVDYKVGDIVEVLNLGKNNCQQERVNVGQRYYVVESYPRMERVGYLYEGSVVIKTTDCNYPLLKLPASQICLYKRERKRK